MSQVILSYVVTVSMVKEVLRLILIVVFDPQITVHVIHLQISVI